MDKSTQIKEIIKNDIQELEMVIEMTSNEKTLDKFKYTLHTLKRILKEIETI